MRLFHLFGLILISASNLVQAATIVVSIQPLAMLVQPLLGPEDSVQVLLKPNTSPHHYSLTASQMSALQSADLVLWVGPSLEQFLIKPLSNLPTALQLEALPGLDWPEEGGDHRDHPEHGARDPHLWLNPDNGIAVMTAVAARLAVLVPSRAEEFELKLDLAEKRLTQLASQLEQSLATMHGVGFIAYHEAYGHWNQRFGLRQVAAVSVTPEQKPGARHIYQLQTKAKEAHCLVAEAFYNNGSSQHLAKDLGLKLVLLDPLGADVIETENPYEVLLNNLAEGMLSCSTNQRLGD